MSKYSVGSLVRCREREWVVLPSPEPDLLLLRPLGGASAEICGVFLPVEGDAIEKAQFAPPDPALAGDFAAATLLRDAARLSLRNGAGPFRALGSLGVRPRPYQLVPLMMALRLDPVRLLIADDVGIGKTVEAGLIVRELLDRGEISRVTVLCPPHLCDQWQRELAQKFALEATVVRSSTAAALERSLPQGDHSIWEHFPLTVASIDYVKSERRRDSFLRAAPELIIVDEAHAAVAAGGSATQQQRFELVRELAANPQRHLLLLTATPHSGVEDAFVNLLSLLDPRFAQLNPARLSEPERDTLARHFVQRRRADVQRWLGDHDVTPFPQRESRELTYSMPRAAAYRKLFDDVFSFTRELVQSSGEHHQRPARQRARYWAALALLRCVMSSPAAAEKALRLRASNTSSSDPADAEAALAARLATLQAAVHDDQEQTPDFEPALGGADEDATLPNAIVRGELDGERARLNRFANRASELRGKDDPKLQRLIQILNELLHDGFQPIVYCRYIATADYLAEELRKGLNRVNGLLIRSVTGDRSEEEREQQIAELEASPRRLLIATDCLSEGINLQGGFDAVIHYDLPWNPNRLEQREGRIDRYGQRRSTVRTVLLYGQDNPMDEAVMKVLLRKAVTIHRALGISVPLPLDGAQVIDALIASLFQPRAEQLSMFDTADQMRLLDGNTDLQAAEAAWVRAEQREKESRTRFAQRRIKPDEVARELEESDAALGDATAVAQFVLGACPRLGAAVSERRSGVYAITLSQLPLPVRERLGTSGELGAELRFSFTDAPPEGVAQLGRNHPLVIALAEHLMETALAPDGDSPVAARAAVIRTRAVSKRTRLLLLRVRMLIESSKQRAPLLAEELVITGLQGTVANPTWLNQPEALGLLNSAQAAANLSRDERTHALRSALAELPELAGAFDAVAQVRAEHLRESHLRVRAQIGGGSVKVRPAGPPDVLSVFVLLPNLD